MPRGWRISDGRWRNLRPGLAANNAGRKRAFSDAEKSFPDLAKANLILIVITMFRLIWHRTELCLVANQSGKGNYNLNLISVNKIQKRFLCAYNSRYSQHVSRAELLQKKKTFYFWRHSNWGPTRLEKMHRFLPGVNAGFFSWFSHTYDFSQRKNVSPMYLYSCHSVRLIVEVFQSRGRVIYGRMCLWLPFYLKRAEFCWA